MSEQPAFGDGRAPTTDDEALRLLREGTIDLEGRLLDASNVTLIGTVRAAGGAQVRVGPGGLLAHRVAVGGISAGSRSAGGRRDRSGRGAASTAGRPAGRRR